MFHHAADELSDAFFQLFEDGRDGILNLDNVFESGLVARNVTKEVGIYLRAVQGYDYYCGISRNIAQRQRQHNAGKPGEQGNRKMRAALAGRSASAVVQARRLVSFGKTGVSECPQPVLHAIETIVICSARLTTSGKSVQVNIVDSPPYVAPSRPRSSLVDTSKGRLLAEVWEKLYNCYRIQEADFARGAYMRFGLRPVPVGLDGISRADYEAKKLIIPVIRNSKFGMASIMANLFRTTVYEKDGDVREESPFKELRQAKSDFPIPDHAFYVGKNGRQCREYAAQGFDGIPLGHYAPWSAKMSGDNGHPISHQKEHGGGMFGLRGDSSLSKAQLEETYQQAWALMEGIQRLGIGDNGLF